MALSWWDPLVDYLQWLNLLGWVDDPQGLVPFTLLFGYLGYIHYERHVLIMRRDAVRLWDQRQRALARLDGRGDMLAQINRIVLGETAEAMALAEAVATVNENHCAGAA